MTAKKTVRRRTSGEDFISALDVRARATSDPVGWLGSLVPVVGPLAKKV